MILFLAHNQHAKKILLQKLVSQTEVIKHRVENVKEEYRVLISMMVRKSSGRVLP